MICEKPTKYSKSSFDGFRVRAKAKQAARKAKNAKKNTLKKTNSIKGPKQIDVRTNVNSNNQDASAPTTLTMPTTTTTEQNDMDSVSTPPVGRITTGANLQRQPLGSTHRDIDNNQLQLP